MKLKLIAVAALAVCGSGAFAAGNADLCKIISTPLDLVTKCAPEAVVNIMGASAQKNSVVSVLARSDSTIFDTTLPLAVITSSDAATAATTASVAGSPVIGVGAKNTTIIYGYGKGVYDAKTNPFGGKRLAVVTNFSNGSFAGLNAMVNTVKAANYDAAETSKAAPFYNETVSFRLLKAIDATALDTCTSAATAPSLNGATAASLTHAVACTTGATRGTSVRDYVNEVPEGAKPGSTIPRGVQMVTLDVAPAFAAPGVVSINFKAANFTMTETGVQGFGIVVNEKLLAALVTRDVTAGKLASDCSTVTTVAQLAASPKCQPSIGREEYAQFVNGTGTAATLFGSADTTPVVLQRRADLSGTQAASNIAFAGQGASRDTKLLAGYFIKGTPNKWMGLTDPVIGAFGSPVALTVVANVGSGDVVTNVSSTTNATSYALGMLSLENVWSATGISAKKVAWIKVDGISPNVNGATGAIDSKQRVGMHNGYPLQFNAVVLKNKATKDVGSITVVDAVIAGLKDPSYNLPGFTYLLSASQAGISANADMLAKYTRTANSYAPLSLYKAQ